MLKNVTLSLAVISYYTFTSLAAFAEVVKYSDAAVELSGVMETVVVTATRNASPVKELTGNMAWLGKNQLSLVDHTHINESMVRVPGAWLSRGNGQEHLTALRSPVLTGAGSCGSFLMAEDGIPLRAAGFCNANQLFDANTEQASRIEVIRGPASAVYGSNALHGVINVLTPSSREQPLKVFHVSAGPHDYLRGKFHGSTHNGTHGYAASINATQDDGYKDDSGYEQKKISLRHDYDQLAGQDGSALTISSGFGAANLKQDTASFITGYKAYKDTDRKKDNPSAGAFRDATSYRAYSRIRYQSDHQSTWLITPYVRHNDMRFSMHWLPWQPIEENGHTSLGVQATYQWQGGGRFSWVGGLDAEYTDAYLKEIQRQAFSPGKPQGVHYNYDVVSAVAAPYIELDWSLSTRTTINAGLRFEHAVYDYDNKLSDGSGCALGVAAVDCRISRPADTKESFQEAIPSLGVVHHLNDQHALFSNVRRGYRVPQATELFRLEEGNVETDLNSVELNSVELGARGAEDKMSYEITLYQMYKDNVIFQNPDRRRVSGAETKHQGIELSLQLQLMDQLSFTGFLSYSRHLYNDHINQLAVNNDIKNNDIDTAPRHMGSAQLAWAYDEGSLMELEWVHMGKYYTDPENDHHYDGHDLLNFRIKYGFSDNLELSIHIKNLADKDFAERADYGFGSERYFVGEPRSLYVGMGVTF